MKLLVYISLIIITIFGASCTSRRYVTTRPAEVIVTRPVRPVPGMFGLMAVTIGVAAGTITAMDTGLCRAGEGAGVTVRGSKTDRVIIGNGAGGNN